jgi:hypothetical protein
MVGRVDAYEHVKSLHDRVSSEPRVQVLAIGPVLEQAKQAHERVKLLVAEVWNWKGFEWHEKKAEAENLCQTFRSRFELMLDHGRSIQEMSLKDKKKEDPHPYC